jgi:hypothetical protein
MLDRMRNFVILIFTWTYSGSLHHYTLDPICTIENNLGDAPLVVELILKFRKLKEYELHFVQRAARHPSTFAAFPL